MWFIKQDQLNGVYNMFRSIIKYSIFTMAFCTLFLSADEVDAWLDDNGKEKVTVGKTKTEIPPEIQEELHKMFQKESQETDKNVNIHANVLIITGNGGSGS